MIGQLRYPDGLLHQAQRAGEVALVHPVHADERHRADRGRGGKGGERFEREITAQRVHVPLEHLDRGTELSAIEVSLAQSVVGQDLELEVPDRGRDGLGTAPGLDRSFVLAHPPEARGHVRRHLPESRLIVEGRGGALGLSQVVEHAGELPEADQRALEITANVYRELTGAAVIWAVTQCRQCLLE